MSEHIWIRAYNRGDAGLHRVGLISYKYEEFTLYFTIVAKSKKDTFNADTAKNMVESREFWYAVPVPRNITEDEIVTRLTPLFMEDSAFMYLLREYDLLTFQAVKHQAKCICDLAHVAHRFSKGL